MQRWTGPTRPYRKAILATGQLYYYFNTHVDAASVAKVPGQSRCRMGDVSRRHAADGHFADPGPNPRSWRTSDFRRRFSARLEIEHLGKAALCAPEEKAGQIPREEFHCGGLDRLGPTAAQRTAPEGRP